MAVSDDLIDFDLIETHKENIQSLPSGRSARQLVSILSPMPSGKASASPSLDETKTLNDAIRQEYELELQSIADSDDPLDIYDRYVKWTLNAYPSAQATPQSKLLPLLERATKAFLTSSHYKNDPRYLKLWLHYIRFFSDSPRETFAFLARHHIGEGLGLFYEEFAAWLEGAERWTQAEEVYKLGIEREARPAERLTRKFAQFQKRFEAKPQNADEPSSPALPTVRPALAAKIDPFASTPRSEEQQPPRPTSGSGSSAPASRSGKTKMAIFSDAEGSAPQPLAVAETKGWDSIGSLQERKKENDIETRSWAGETLKAGKKVGTVPKMAIFKDQTTRSHESRSKQKPHPDPAVVNPKTGKSELVFVNLEAVYPNEDDPSQEFSFEELRAINRGWAAKDWRRRPASPLRTISINIQQSPSVAAQARSFQITEELSQELQKKLAIGDENSSQLRISDGQQAEIKETKSAKPKKIKIREIKQEAQTVKTNLESPTGPKLRRKNSAEPTMTFHSKAATDEVYNMFNQPSRHDTSRDDSDEEDDDYSTAGESTGTGRISGTTSEFGDEDTIASAGTTGDENTRTGSQPDSVSPWSEFTASKHVPKIRSGRSRNNMSEEVTENLSSSQNQTQSISGFDTQAIAAIAGQEISDLNTQVIAAMAGDFGEDEEEEKEEEELKTPISPDDSKEIEVPNKPRYIPLPPEDYEPTPLRPFRDPEAIAQNRLPFMTPIVEKTESSLAPSTMFYERDHLVSKTPSHSNSVPVSTENSPSRLKVDQLLLESPSKKSPSPHKRKLSTAANDHESLIASPPKLKSKFSDSKSSSERNPAQPVFAVPQPPPLKSATTDSTNILGRATPLKGPIIQDLQCNPVDASTHQRILACIHPALNSYDGFRDNSAQPSGRYHQIQSFAKKVAASKTKASPRKNQNEKTLTHAVQPLLEFQGSTRVYAVKRELGKGAYAPVYLVDSYDRNAGDDECDTLGSTSDNSKRKDLEAIKTEDPPSAWEFYILRILKHRLGHMSRTMQSIIVAHECQVFKDECFLVLEYRPQGTLLDLVNAAKDENRKAGKPSDVGLDEVLAMFMSVELLRLMEACHAVGVIHGDLKADNCLVRFDGGELLEPYQRDGCFGWQGKGMMLIDFGRGIDFRAFKPEVQFIADWPSSAQDCAEIREARPWTWQIDYFGAAGVIHSLLFGKYVETVPLGGGGLGQKKEWKLKEGFKRYWQQGIWADVFGLLLNPSLTVDGEAMPCLKNLKRVREGMEFWLEEEGERKGLRAQIRRAEVLVNTRRK